MKAAAQKAAAASKAAASKAAAGKAAGGKASGLKKKAAATAKGSALGRVVAAKQAAATWAEAVKAKAGKGEGRGRGGAEGKGTAKGGEADVFNPSFVSSLIQGSRELVARDGSQQVAGLANAEEGAKDKKELLRAMVVVDSLQRQLDSEGSARKRMIHKLKKEQKRAKLMCEILREQQAMFLYESNDAPQDNAGDGSDSGLSSSMQRNGAVNEIAAKIQRIEKEVKDRESQMQELESVQIEFEKDADNLRQTVHGTLKELGARGAESATVRKEIEGLRAAVKGSLDKIRRREEEKERKIARQQQARDEFFLTRLSEVEARAAAAERELGAVTHGVGRLDSTLMRAESRLMGNDALGVSSPIRTSPHMSRAASPLRGTCALTFAGSQGAFRPTTATHCDFHHPPSRCCCSHAGAGSPGWQSSPASPRSFSPLSHSPAGWSDVPQYCASRRCPTNHGFDPGAQGMTDSTRQRHAPGRSVSFQEGHHESVNFENDSRRGRAITIPTTTTMNSSYWDAAPKSGVGGEGAETGTSRMPNGETCSPQDGGQQREATPLESQASTGRDTSHPECTPNTVGRNTHTDPRHAAGPTLSQGTDELPPGASRGLDIKSATDVLKGALEDVRSQLNSGEGDAHLLARLEDFMGKLHEIEGEHDAKVRSLESEWSTRLARAEERLAQSLEISNKDHEIQQLRQTRRTPVDDTIPGLLADQAAVNREADDALQRLEIENQELRAQIAEAATENRSLNSKSCALEGEVERLHGCLSDTRNHSKEVEASRDRSQARADLMESDIRKLRCTLKEAESQLQEVRADLKQVKAAQGRGNDALSHDVELEVAKSQLEALSHRFEDKTQEIATLRGLHANVTADLMRTKQRLEDVEAELAGAKEMAWHQHHRMGCLASPASSASLADFTMAPGSATAAVPRLKEQLRVKAAQLDAAAEQLQIASARSRDQLESHVQELESEVAHLNNRCSLALHLSQADSANAEGLQTDIDDALLPQEGQTRYFVTAKKLPSPKA